jgi:hypothetical protein
VPKGDNVSAHTKAKLLLPAKLLPATKRQILGSCNLAYLRLQQEHGTCHA